MNLSTPVLWVILPLIIAAIAGIFYHRHVLGILLTSGLSLGLGLLAAFFPESMTFSLGPLTIIFNESLGILGRQITLAYEILPFIAFIYAMTALWTLSSGILGVPIIFRPISLIITALLTAALGVEPFLYAALLIETAVLFSIPMLSPVEKETQAGILRYLSLQTLAMPLILLAGWLLTGVETLPPDSALVGQTMVVLGLGFALLLGVFPFHSWLPMMSQYSHPTVVSFLMFIMPTTILVFGLNFIDRYTFLRISQDLYEILRIMGALMIVLGGAWTAIQDNLKRVFGFSVLTETGFSILAVGLSAQGGLNWMLLLFPVRALGFWLWGFTLALIETKIGSLEFNAIKGFAHRYPILSIGLLMAQLSIAGLPLLAAFPIKIALFTAAFGVETGLGLWSFIGNLGLFLFTIRLLADLISPTDTTLPSRWSFSEKPHEYLPVLAVILALVLLGLFPNSISSNITHTLTAFTQLQ